MTTSIDLNELMNQFRIASRELFNHFFRIPNPYESSNQAWLLEERFRDLQAMLFQKLVAEPASLELSAYGNLQPRVMVVTRQDGGVPIMLNREIDSAYWDYPITQIDNSSRLLFVCFFDWDVLDYRDNRYVRAQITHSSSHPEIVGKHALIESQYVKFREQTVGLSVATDR